MTPPELVIQAADRLLKMGYPNDLTEEERCWSGTRLMLRWCAAFLLALEEPNG